MNNIVNDFLISGSVTLSEVVEDLCTRAKTALDKLDEASKDLEDRERQAVTLQGRSIRVSMSQISMLPTFTSVTELTKEGQRKVKSLILKTSMLVEFLVGVEPFISAGSDLTSIYLDTLLDLDDTVTMGIFDHTLFVEFIDDQHLRTQS